MKSAIRLADMALKWSNYLIKPKLSPKEYEILAKATIEAEVLIKYIAKECCGDYKPCCNCENFVLWLKTYASETDDQ